MRDGVTEVKIVLAGEQNNATPMPILSTAIPITLSNYIEQQAP